MMSSLPTRVCTEMKLFGYRSDTGVLSSIHFSDKKHFSQIANQSNFSKRQWALQTNDTTNVLQFYFYSPALLNR